jgi:hypothetical protein
MILSPDFNYSAGGKEGQGEEILTISLDTDLTRLIGAGMRNITISIPLKNGIQKNF